MALYLALWLCVYLVFTQGAEGSINEFECVGIYKQPAFQHPLLKNHKIQETFSSSYENVEKSNKYKIEGHCPKATVPIFREKNGPQNFYVNTVQRFGQHFATIETMLDGTTIYRGAEASISIHSLNLLDHQYSKSQIWLENGSIGQRNSIQAGWAVHPSLYGDNVTRFTIYWTRDDFRKTGCYNTQCPGFVVVSQNSIIGKEFSNSSIYGKTSIMFKIQIFQDGFSGNWALKVDNEVIGYWPKALFTFLNIGAVLVRYGGNTYVSPNGTSPPMGNGYFPDADYKKTAYFENVRIINSDYEKVDIEGKRMRRYADNYSCFRVAHRPPSKYGGGKAFSFGGPGGKCGI